MKKKSNTLKSFLSHSKNHFKLRISCGDFYLREDISWEEDIRYCRDLLDFEFKHLDEKLESFKVFMEYTAPLIVFALTGIIPVNFPRCRLTFEFALCPLAPHLH